MVFLATMSVSHLGTISFDCEQKHLLSSTQPVYAIVLNAHYLFSTLQCYTNKLAEENACKRSHTILAPYTDPMIS